MKAHRGFTLTELVIVLIITGVLAAVAIPRLFNQDQFAARAAHDFIVSSLRYAQKSAIAMRRQVCVNTSATNLSITFSNSFSNNVGNCSASNKITNPSNGSSFIQPVNALPGGATMTSNVQFSFDSTGRPMTFAGPGFNSPYSISVNGYSQPVTIEPESGLVR